jgi:hypothetical protein
MKVKECSSWPVHIHMAGIVSVAGAVCRKFCDDIGLCIRINKTTFIYEGGEEKGFTISLMNYPRFPKTTGEIENLAIRLGKLLREKCKQESFSIETPNTTVWFSDREEDNKE